MEGFALDSFKARKKELGWGRRNQLPDTEATKPAYTHPPTHTHTHSVKQKGP